MAARSLARLLLLGALPHVAEGMRLQEAHLHQAKGGLGLSTQRPKSNLKKRVWEAILAPLARQPENKAGTTDPMSRGKRQKVKTEEQVGHVEGARPVTPSHSADSLRETRDLTKELEIAHEGPAETAAHRMDPAAFHDALTAQLRGGMLGPQGERQSCSILALHHKAAILSGPWRQALRRHDKLVQCIRTVENRLQRRVRDLVMLATAPPSVRVHLTRIIHRVRLRRSSKANNLEELCMGPALHTWSVEATAQSLGLGNDEENMNSRAASEVLVGCISAVQSLLADAELDKLVDIEGGGAAAGSAGVTAIQGEGGKEAGQVAASYTQDLRLVSRLSAAVARIADVFPEASQALLNAAKRHPEVLLGACSALRADFCFALLEQTSSKVERSRVLRTYAIDALMGRFAEDRCRETEVLGGTCERIREVVLQECFVSARDIMQQCNQWFEALPGEIGHGFADLFADERHLLADIPDFL